MRRYAPLAAICAVLLSLAAVLWWQSRTEGAAPAEGAAVEGSTEPPEALASEAIPAPEARTEADAARRPIESGPAAAPAAGEDTGALLVRIVHADDGTPAARLGGFVREKGVVERKRFATDDRGEVTIEGLRPGPVVVVNDLQRMQAARATVAAGQQVELTVELKDGIDIHGLVVDAADRPVPGAAIVLAEWAASEPRVICETDARGRFDLRQASRMCNVAARAKGYAPSPCHSVTAGAGAEIDLRIVLSGAGGSVHGQVLGPGGDPVDGATVGVGVQPPFGLVITLPDGSQGMNPPRCQVQTDAEGRFEADGIAAGKAPVDVRAERMAPWSGSVEVVGGAVSPLVIRMTEGVTCEGTVTDGAGQPVAGVTVQHGAWSSPARRETRTAADGSYRLEGLPAGAIAIEVRGENHGNATTEIQGQPGETVRWDVTLSRGLVLTGVVRNEAGEPIQGVMIEGMGPFTKGRATWGQFEQTDAKGAFELVDCPPGPVIRLTLQHRHYAKLERAAVDAAAGALELTMSYLGEATGRIVGTVLDPAGQPVGDAQVTISGPAGGGFVESTTAEGRIDIDKQRPGTYWLRVRAGALAEHVTPPFELAKGATADLGAIQLARGGRVRVALERPAETEAETLYLSVYRPPHQYLASVRQPELTSDAVAPGHYELRATGPKVIPRSVPFTVVDGQDVEVPVAVRFGLPRTIELELPPGSDDVTLLDFTVTGPQGFRFARQQRRFRAGPVRYELGLSPGRYTVSARSDHGHTGSAELEVEEGGPETLRVVLQ